MKKTVILALAAATAACTLATGCSGCNAANKNAVPLVSTWYTDVSFKNIQTTFNKDKNYPAETLEYTVTQTQPASGGNATYKVEYSESKYTTSFYATTFPRDLVLEKYAETFPKDGTAGGIKDFVVYCFETSFHSDKVTYTYKNESKDFTDDVATICYFASVNDNLRPLYSKTVLKSPSPAAYAAVSLSSCYTYFDRAYETFYNFSGTEATKKLTLGDGDEGGGENGEKTVYCSDKQTLNYVFDANSVAVVARSLSNGSLPQTLSLVTAANGLQEFAFKSYTGASYTISDEELNDAGALMAAKNLYVATEDSKFETVAVSVSSTLALAGVEPVYWFAKVGNSSDNRGRATMIKYVEPLTYGLGTLTYTLKEIASTPWNG